MAKTLTREIVPLKNWNKNWHDHKVEIATGRVVVLDRPPDKAKEVADLIASKLSPYAWYAWQKPTTPSLMTRNSADGQEPDSHQDP